MIDAFKKNIHRLAELIAQSQQSPARRGLTGKPSSRLLDFQATKQEYRTSLLKSQFEAVQKQARELAGISHIGENKVTVAEIQSMSQKLELNEPDKNIDILAQIADLCEEIEEPALASSSLKAPPLPETIRDEVNADIQELSRCMGAGCYRSATILCGRILETALHSKYFLATGQDILEKNPGIGLGNLIAKLAEKNVALDPGLTQQIHLINQVRVFSVHKKQEPFNPSKAQAEAMVLYTLDSLEKLFPKKR